MSKCIENNRNGAIDYECPYCGKVFELKNPRDHPKERCKSHVYKKHREQAHADTIREHRESEKM